MKVVKMNAAQKTTEETSCRNPQRLGPKNNHLLVEGRFFQILIVDISPTVSLIHAKSFLKLDLPFAPVHFSSGASFLRQFLLTTSKSLSVRMAITNGDRRWPKYTYKNKNYHSS